MTARCAACERPIERFGRRQRLINGVKVWVGTCCGRAGESINKPKEVVGPAVADLSIFNVWAKKDLPS